MFVFCCSERLEGKAQYGTHVCRSVGVGPKAVIASFRCIKTKY